MKVLQRTVEATVGASGSAQAVIPSDGNHSIGEQEVSYRGPLMCAERPASSHFCPFPDPVL